MKPKFMNKLLVAIAISVIYCPMSVFGITVHVSTPGTLESVIDEIDDYSFPELTITGELNAVDVVFLCNQSGRLGTVQRLDLSGINFVEGGGAYATISIRKTTAVIEDYTYTFYFSHEYKSHIESSSSMLGGWNHAITTYTDDMSGMFYKSNYPEVVIPGSVSKIGKMAFYKSNIRSVGSVKPIESIGENAFANCNVLETINIESVSEIGDGAFDGCCNLYFSADSTLNILSTENIGKTAFRDCVSIRKINLSQSLKTIGDRAFYSCDKISELTIPSSVKHIGDYAFSGCIKIKNVTLPLGLESIGKYAFSRCELLADVVIEGNPAGLSRNTFSSTPFFDSLKPEDDNIIYLNNIAIMEYRTTKAPHTLVFKDGTVEIGDDFIGSSYEYVTGVVLPSTLKKIGDNAFSYFLYDSPHSELSSVNFPEGLEEIGSNAFSGSKITELSFPSTLRKIGEKAFYGCSQLQGELVITKGITNIGISAFDDTNLFQITVKAENLAESPCICRTAERLKVGAQVRILPNKMFSYGNYKKVTYEERSDEAQLLIGEKCFYCCSNLQSVSLPKGNIEICDQAFCESGVSVLSVAGVVKNVGKSAFEKTRIKELNFIDGLEYIGEKAFYYCDSLKSANLGNTVRYIGGNAFGGSMRLQNISLGEQLDSIGYDAFRWCESLENVELPQSLKYLGEGAFSSCSKLKAINIPNGIETIGTHSFSNCKSMTTVAMPEKLKSIGKYAFLNCSGLTRVEFPSTLESISKQAFYDCSALKDIICLGNVPPTASTDAFSRYNATLYVYENSLQSYKETSPWSRFTMETMAGGEGDPKVCATPTISFVDGSLSFSCDTEGAEIFYRLTSNDIRSYDTSVTTDLIPLSACYEISCYAKASGYLKSPTAKAKLCWLQPSLDNEDGILNANTTRGVILSSSNGTITLSGLDKDEVVDLYSISGTMLSRTTAMNGTVKFHVSGEQVVIVRIGEQSIKMIVE